MVVGTLLVGGGFLTASLSSQTQLEAPLQAEFKTKSTYLGGTQSYPDVVVADQYVTIAADTGSSNNRIDLKLNQTGFTMQKIRTLRGFNLTFSDDGITTITFSYYEYGYGEKILLTSSKDEITITDKGTYSIINASWELSTVLGWEASNSYDESGDYYFFKIMYDTDYDESADQIITWNWIVASDGDTIYYLSWFMMSLGFALPFFFVLDISNVKSKIRIKPKK